ncbi:hypothetical protein SY89_01348 [Halolamina pelagica]|uniref:Uncharacterized protein n=1 Tax=Halolamina pelagica TaxID=699431 RepID=A0A0P7GP71_9EURY|nr:hypothetical protein [Halolamina pelagica]KPN30612.1 hypothetical protein SY89_01348 [Halolamina pelagica]
MRPRRSLHVVFALLLALAAVAAVPAADARAPPTPVCGVCSFDTTVDGTDVAADESELTVRIHANGSTTWIATVELARGAASMAENDSFRRAVVDEAMGWSVAEPEAVRSSVDDGTLTVRYRDDEAAERHVGAVVFTPLTPEGPNALFASGGEGPRYLGTDRFTLRAPAGYDLHGGGETGDAGELVWTRADGTERTSLDVSDDPVAVDADSAAPGIRTWFARLLS